MRTRRVVPLTSAALLALALTASTASATVLDPTNNAYTGAISASTSSSTLSNELISITCANTFEATIDSGDSGDITNMTFQNCSPVATVAVEGLPYSFDITEFDLTITSAGAMTINAGGVFHCTASWTAGDIVGDVDWTTDTITFGGETLTVSGAGCGSTASWTGVYAFVPDLHWG